MPILHIVSSCGANYMSHQPTSPNHKQVDTPHLGGFNLFPQISKQDQIQFL